MNRSVNSSLLWHWNRSLWLIKPAQIFDDLRWTLSVWWNIESFPSSRKPDLFFTFITSICKNTQNNPVNKTVNICFRRSAHWSNTTRDGTNSCWRIVLTACSPEGFWTGICLAGGRGIWSHDDVNCCVKRKMQMSSGFESQSSSGCRAWCGIVSRSAKTGNKRPPGDKRRFPLSSASVMTEKREWLTTSKYREKNNNQPIRYFSLRSN